MTWMQIIVLLFGILLCSVTVTICDITIIKEIKVLGKTMRKFINFPKRKTKICQTCKKRGKK